MRLLWRFSSFAPIKYFFSFFRSHAFSGCKGNQKKGNRKMSNASRIQKLLLKEGFNRVATEAALAAPQPKKKTAEWNKRPRVDREDDVDPDMDDDRGSFEVQKKKSPRGVTFSFSTAAGAGGAALRSPTFRPGSVHCRAGRGARRYCSRFRFAETSQPLNPYWRTWGRIPWGLYQFWISELEPTMDQMVTNGIGVSPFFSQSLRRD